MATIDLAKYGITGVEEVLYNPSYETLFEEETKEGLTGFDKGVVTEMGAVNVMTGVYTGRSPKDKFFVMDETTKDTIWWTSDEYKNDNKPVTEAAWAELKKIAAEELSNKKLYVVDTFCGANENTRLKIRFIMEVARHHDEQRITMIGHPNGTHGFRISDGFGYLFVASRFSVRNLA